MQMKLNRRVLLSILSVLLLLTSTVAYCTVLYNERNQYRTQMKNEAFKNIYDLIAEVDNLKVNLTKAEIINTREQGIIAFEQIYMHAVRAIDKVNSLPLDMVKTNHITKYFTVLSDLATSLGRSISSGVELKESDYKNIQNLKRQTSELEVELNKVAQSFSSEKEAWWSLRNNLNLYSQKLSLNTISGKFMNLQNQIMDYPELIYDGAFSETVEKITPKINSMAKVTNAYVENVIKNALGSQNIKKIKLKANTGKGVIEAYSYEIFLKADEKKATCDISVHGGKIINLASDREVKSAVHSFDEAAKLGEKYLLKLGYKNMKPAYYIRYDNTMTINYVYEQGNVIMYPDQIKVKLALDNGNVLGIECEKYLIAHEDVRQGIKPEISISMAESKISKRLRVSAVKLVVIPNPNGSEELCYEFSGKCNDDEFKVYINAMNGKEEKILQVLNTMNGKLTI